ncbi:hypothetical protein [Ancylobacter sp.]|uniref:hypothetical protein n=1 Tax=Ancylobacter sp. TaxID=1872567 RepID=UPI003D0AC606
MSVHLTEGSADSAESEASHMSGVAQASEALDQLVQPWPARKSFKEAVAIATKLVNDIGIKSKILSAPIKHSRIEDLWKREARRVNAEELDAIRAARDAKLQRNASDQHQRLVARIARLEAALRLSDEDAYRELAGERRELARGADRPLDRHA